MYEFKDNTLIITNNSYKKEILESFSKEKKLLNVKIISMKELIDRYYFTYDNKAIIYLIEKYKIKYDIAKTYLNNLIYINDNISNSDKLNKLKNIKQELTTNNLLIYDDLFKEYLKSKTIVFVGFNNFKKLEKKVIEELKLITKVEIIPLKEEKYNHKVYEFETIEDEVTYVAKEISNLLENGISITNIKLTNVDSDYLYVIHRIFSFYNLKIEEESTLYSTSVAQCFLNNFSVPFNIEILKEKYTPEEINPLIKILNNYVNLTSFSKESLKELITNDLKNTKIRTPKTHNTIEVISYKDYIKDDNYIFMLNFNLNKIPKMHKDEDFITDNLKNNLELDSTLEKNIMEKEDTMKAIQSIKNLIITYKTSSPYQVFHVSNLADDLNLEIIKKEIDYKKSYSELEDKINLTKKLDLLMKYGTKDESLKLLYNNYKEIPYQTYDNSYTKINSKKMLEYINNKLSLSYSSMTNYYKCAFKYYLSSILRLDIYEENFNTYIGSLFHYVLEKGLKEEIDINKTVNNFLEDNKKELTNKEKFFIENLIPELKFILETIKEQLKFTKLNETLFEEEIVVEKDSNLKVTFKGFIDKLMYKKEGNKTIVAIIDYKTGTTPYDLKLAPSGLNLQLPVYLYLAKHTDKLENIEFAGFYIQEILNKEVTINKKQDYYKTKKDLLKLHGYSNTNEEILSQFDSSYKDSEVVKSLKMTNSNTFYSYSKVINDNEINNLITLVDNKINEAIENIADANFTINPKRTKTENISCKFCSFKDICFKKYKDEIEITEEKDLSFLGGEENA